MQKLDKLKIQYNDIKDKYLKDNSVNVKEDLLAKLIEMDYAFNESYEKDLDVLFPMTTTLSKEEVRLENLISYVEKNVNIQNDLISEYKKLTGDVIELSYLKYSDNIKEFKTRLSNIRKILNIIDDIKELYISDSTKNEFKIKTHANKLLKKEYLNLLYEFCLIDKIDVDNIDIDKLINDNLKGNNDNYDIEVKDDKEIDEKNEEKEDIVEIKEREEDIKEEEKQEENKILTSMPKIDKIGSVVPVNVFESLKKASNELPDVVLPSNGLKDSENDIFLDTKDMFEDEKKNQRLRKRGLIFLKTIAKRNII